MPKHCEHVDCLKQPTYNLPTETNALYCREHKKENMINVKNKKCVHKDLTSGKSLLDELSEFNKDLTSGKSLLDELSEFNKDLTLGKTIKKNKITTADSSVTDQKKKISVNLAIFPFMNIRDGIRVQPKYAEQVRVNDVDVNTLLYKFFEEHVATIIAKSHGVDNVQFIAPIVNIMERIGVDIIESAKVPINDPNFCSKALMRDDYEKTFAQIDINNDCEVLINFFGNHQLCACKISGQDNVCMDIGSSALCDVLKYCKQKKYIKQTRRDAIYVNGKLTLTKSLLKDCMDVEKINIIDLEAPHEEFDDPIGRITCDDNLKTKATVVKKRGPKRLVKNTDELTVKLTTATLKEHDDANAKNGNKKTELIT